MKASNKTRRKGIRRIVLWAGALAFAACLPRAEAVDRTWLTATSGGAWLTTSNWSGGAVPGVTDVAVFNTNPGSTGNVGVNMGTTDRSVGAITVESTRTNALNIGNSSTGRVGTFTLTGSAGAINGVDNVILRNNSGQLLTLQHVQSGTMVVALGNTTDNVVLIESTGGVTISSTVTGASRNLTRTGAGSGVLTLSAANTYSGTTTITQGAVAVENNSALGTSTVVVSSGGQLQIGAGRTINRPITISGAGLAGQGLGAIYGNFGGSGTSTYSGSVTLGAAGVRLGVTGDPTAVLVVSGTIDSGVNPFGVIIRSASNDDGTVQFSAANTYLGSTEVLLGTLRLSGGANRLPTTTNVVLGWNGTGSGTQNTILQLNGQNQEVAGLSLRSDTFVTGSNNVVSNTSATLSTFTVNTGTTASSYNGVLAGNLKLVKTGTNSLTFTGTGTNYGTGSSYSGGVDLNAGTLILGHTNALGSGTLALNGGTIASLGATARAFSNRVAVGGDAAFGDTANTGPLTFSGSVNLGGAARTLTTVASTTFSGAVTNGDLTKQGAATLVLTNSGNSFGGLTVNGGTVSIGANTVITGLAGSGGALNLAAGTLTLTPAASGTVALPFNGSGGFTKSGANLLALTGNSSGYAGTTTVSQGTLLANGVLGGTVSVSSGATLGGSGTVGIVSITGGATLSPGNSPGVLTTGAMTWEGGGNYNWQLYDVNAAAGTGFDTISGGTLTINATSGTRFNINLWTLSGTGPDTNGSALNFDATQTRFFPLGTFTSISGFTPDAFTVVTSATNGTGGFANPFTGSFSVTTSGNSLFLVYASTSDFTAGTGDWSSAGSWAGGVVPSGTATIAFSGPGGTSTNDVALGQVASLTFTGSAAGGYTVAGNAITLGLGGIANDSSFAQAISADVTLAAGASLAANTGNLTFSGTVNDGGFPLIVTGSGNTSLGVVSGTGSFAKTGSGTATLTDTVAAPTVTVSAGTVLIGGSDLLSDSAAVAVSGGTLDLQSANDTVGSFAISAGTLAGAGTLTAATYALGGGAVNANLGTGTATSSAGTTTLDGTLAGNLTVAGGTVALGATDRISAASAVSITSGSLGLGSFNDTVASFSISGGSLGGSGTLTAATYALNGGTVAANLGSGSATASSGVTSLVGTLAGDLTISGGAVILGASNRISDLSTVSLTTGFFNVDGVSDTIGSFVMSGGNVFGSGTLTAPTYTFLGGGRIVANLGSGTITAAPGGAILEGTSAAEVVNISGFLATGSAERLSDSAAVTLSAGNFNLGGTETVGSFTMSGGSLNGEPNRLIAPTYMLTGGTVNARLGLGNEGTVTVSSGTVTMGASGRLASSLNLVVSSGQLTLNSIEVVNSYTQSGGTLEGTGAQVAAGSGTYALTGGTVNANLSAPGVLTANAGAITLNGTASARTVTIAGGTLTTGGANKLADNAAVTMTAGGLTLGGNETVGTYTQWGGTLAGSGTLTAGTYTIFGGTVSAPLGSTGTVAFFGGGYLANPGQTVVNPLTIGGTAQTPFVAYWNMQTAAVTTTSGSAISFGDVVQGNNNGTTTVFGTTSPSSGYTLASGTSASSLNNAGANTINGAINPATSTYFGVTLTGSAGTTFVVSNVQFGSRSTSTGAAAYDFRYGGDSFAATTGTGALATTSSWAAYNVNTTGTVVSGTVAYRLYGVNGAGSAGGAANWRIDDLRLSGTTFSTSNNFATTQLGIGSAGAVTYLGDIAVSGTAALTAATGGTATFSGVVSGSAGSIVKTGPGTVILTGSNPYAGATTVSQGTLTVLGGGRIAGTSGVSVAGGARLRALGEIGTSGSSTPVTVNGILSGTGRLFGTVGGSGSIDPGSSPGIVTLDSIDPSAGLDHNFELTAFSPDYTTSGTGALNDIVHVTGATPFTAGLSAANGNAVNVYFNAGSLISGTTYVGGFFVDQAASLAAFLADIEQAQFNFFVADAVLGDVTYEGMNYLSLAGWNSANAQNLSVDVGGLFVANAGFETGSTSGYVTTFSVVPEPSALALAGLGLAAGVWARRRRTAGGRSGRRCLCRTRSRATTRCRG